MAGRASRCFGGHPQGLSTSGRPVSGAVDAATRGILYPEHSGPARDPALGESRIPTRRQPYGTFEQRRREALEDAAEREDNVFSEIAKVELGRWTELKIATLSLRRSNRINRRADCSDFYMVGLLGMMHRSMDDPAFPQELIQPLEACVLGFKYWMDEPGSDAMCYWSENHQILFHTCEIMAGQLYPEQTFSNVAQTGAWHREKGERMALSWLRKRASGGFREWDSNCYFEEDILALAHLADLAEHDQVREFAAIVLDKLLFSMAINSYPGCLRLDAWTHVYAADQRRPVGIDSGYQPVDVGHGSIQSSYPGDCQPGLCPGLRTAVDHPGYCRRSARGIVVA